MRWNKNKRDFNTVWKFLLGIEKKIFKEKYVSVILDVQL